MLRLHWENGMKKWAALAIALLLAACGSSRHTHTNDDDPATMEDFDEVEVYEGPEGDRRTNDRNNGDTTVENESSTDRANPRETPTRDPDPVEPIENPRRDPDPEVEKPKEDPVKEDPVKDPDPEVEKPKEDPVKEDPVKDPEPDPAAEHEKLADEFIRAVNMKVFELEESKAWEAYLDAIEDFNKRYDKAKEKRNDKGNGNGKGNDKGKDLEQAWADTIEAWYEARYFQALFLHLYTPADDYMPVFVHDRNEVLTLSDEQLDSADCQLTQAANELVGGKSKELMQFQTDVLKYDLTASKVYSDDKWEKRWADEKEKWEDAGNGKFDEKDIKKYGG
jgi:hypothetical protein